MAGQTTYNETPDVALPGMAADNGPSDDVSFTNEEADGMKGGVLIRQGTDSGDGQFLAAASDEPLGVVMHQHNSDADLASPLIIAADSLGAARRKGRVWVVCEEAIAIGDRVFARHTTAGAEVAGEFRNDADGVAQVTTGTPTAVNDALYSILVSVYDPAATRQRTFTFDVTGDASATATEICDDFRTAMLADTAFDALVDSTGTATLILTAQAPDILFDVNDTGVGVVAFAATTAGAPDCLELKNARWAGPSATYNSVILAPLDLNLV